MATVNDLHNITDWVKEKVCSRLLLKKYAEGSVLDYELVHPRAIPVYMPSRGRDEEENAIPCIIVSLIDAVDYPKQKYRRYTIQLTVIIYNPGTAGRDTLIRTGDGSYITGESCETVPNKQAGWQDVFNTIDLVKHEIEKTDFITPELRIVSGDGITYSLQDPQDATARDYPLFSGFINFTVTAGYVPAEKYSELL